MNKNEFEKDNFCEVVFILPKILSSRKIILEEAKNVVVTNAEIPVNIPFYEYEHRFNSKNMEIDLNIKFESIEVFNELKKWYDIMYKIDSKFRYRRYELVGDIIISSYDLKGLLLRRIRYLGCKIEGLSKLDNINVCQFTADFYTEMHDGSCDSVVKEGYHLTNISKGKLGTSSKIEEELSELKDAETQGSKIMVMVELSDLYGAIEEMCIKYGVTMEDLKKFSDITKRAFKNGRRK